MLQDTCDIMSVALVKHPLATRGLALDIVLLTYLSIFGCTWGAWASCVIIMGLAALSTVHYCNAWSLHGCRAYWVWSAVHYATDLKDMLEVSHNQSLWRGWGQWVWDHWGWGQCVFCASGTLVVMHDLVKR